MIVRDKCKTEFTREELLDILNDFLKYKPAFDKDSSNDIQISRFKAAHCFTRLLYNYEVLDRDMFSNLKIIREKYGKKYINDLSKEKLDFLEIITIFTFIHRVNRHDGHDGWYLGCIEDNTYYNLLCRMEEIKNEL